jgi:hypothetical protein
LISNEYHQKPKPYAYAERHSTAPKYPNSTATRAEPLRDVLVDWAAVELGEIIIRLDALVVVELVEDPFGDVDAVLEAAAELPLGVACEDAAAVPLEPDGVKPSPLMI